MKTLLKNIVVLVLFLCSCVGLAQQQSQSIKTNNGWEFGAAFYYVDSDKTVNVLGNGYQKISNWGTTSSFNGENQLQIVWQIELSSYPEILDTMTIVLGSLNQVNLKSAAIAIDIQDSSYFASLGYFSYISNQNGLQYLKFPLRMLLNQLKAKMTNIQILSLAFVLVSQDSCKVGFDAALYKIIGNSSGKNTTYFDASITGVSKKTQTPKEFKLEQNYPNPFNPTTKIQFTLSEKTKVELVVFNSLGQEIQSLVSGELGQGNHEVSFDASKLPSGIYLYRLQAGNLVETKKMVLLK
jgi:hypothetical protein